MIFYLGYMRFNLYRAKCMLILLILSSVSSALSAQMMRASQERLYVHFNKNLYIPGEIAWFSIYCYDEATQKPCADPRDRLVFLDLVDAEGQMVLSSKVTISDEYSKGASFFVPADVKSGDYWVLAYSEKRESHGLQGIYRRKLRIVNPMDPNFRNIISPLKPELILRAEGGNLVLGKANRVAFFMEGIGLGQFPFTLYVEEDRGGIYEFESNTSGQGVFDFFPQSGEVYKAYVQFKDGSYMDVAFPKPIFDRPGLRVDALADGSGFEVTPYWTERDRFGAGPLSGSFYLRAQRDGRMLKEIAISPQQNGTAFPVLLPGNVLGSVWFELWDQQENQLLASRLALRGKPDFVELPVTFPVTSSLDSRVSENFRLQTSKIGQDARLSISIYKSSDAPADEYVQNMVGDRWLFSNDVRSLSGFNAERARFLETGNATALDAYLIAQSPAAGHSADHSRQERPGFGKLRIRALHKRTNDPVGEQYFYLSVPDKREQLYLSKTDHEGFAEFTIDPIFGSREVVLTAVTGEPGVIEFVDDPVHLSLVKNLEKLADLFVSRDRDITRFDSGLEKWLEVHNINVQSENAYFRKERAEADTPKALSQAPFYGAADRVYRLDDYTRFVLMEEVLTEYIPEIRVLKRAGSYELRVYDIRSNLFFDQNPLVLLDGVPLRDLNKLIAYDPKNIESVEIIQTRFVYGPLEFSGIVSFNTYAGDMIDFELEPETVLYDLDGYYVDRKFFSPNYDNESGSPGLSARLPDFRNVLLWQDGITTTGKEDLVVRFETSDLKGEFVIEIEGMDASGRILKGKSKLVVR